MSKPFILFLSIIGFSLSARANNATQEDSVLENATINEHKIEELSSLILTEISDAKKDSISDELKTLLSKELTKKQAFSFAFNSVKSLTILTPKDSAFRIFNWSIAYLDGTHSYECALLKRKEGKNTSLTFLEPYQQTPDKETLTQATGDESHWLGGLYYQIIEKKGKFQTYYTMLTWDGNNLLTNKKHIEVMWFNQKGAVKFGAPIFKSNRKTASRILFEFGGQHAMKLSYDEESDHIIFDYLVPLNPRLEGVYEYYYPDVTQDAYKWNGDAWVFHKLIDGDENLKKSKKNFPTYGKEKIQEQTPVYSPPK